jgi:hypothetical protein
MEDGDIVDPPVPVPGRPNPLDPFDDGGPIPA